MKALEFKSKIKNNIIQIPDNIHSKLKKGKERDVRVIVLFEDPDEVYDDLDFKNAAATSFLKGYSDSDSIYDNY